MSDQEATDETGSAASETKAGHTLRGKKWIFGATLAAAGLVVGSGATYAITAADASPTQVNAQQSGRGGPGGGEMGAPPDGAAGQAPPDGTASSSG